MTTAHKPTFHPAIGTANQGGYRYVVKRQQFSSRDLPGQLDLKLRQPGQNTTEEIAKRDLKAELEQREAKYYAKKQLERQRQGLLSEPAALELENKNKERLALTYEKELEGFDDSDDSDSGSEDDSADDSDLDSEDEEKALMAELAAIKKEKALQKAKEEAEEAKLREMQEENALICGNPLINNSKNSSNKKSATFTLKRSWTEDTVFKNQAPEPKRRKRFINDTIRSDFHRKFMMRYIK
eukprot:UN04559